MKIVRIFHVPTRPAAALSLILTASFAPLAAAPLSSVGSVWQFESDTSESNGGTGLVPTGFFPTYSSASIGSEYASVMDVPALQSTDWLEMANGVGGNGGSLLGRTNNWTIMMDVCFPAQGNDASLLQTDPLNTNDAEVHIGGGQGVHYEYWEPGLLSQLPDFTLLGPPDETGTVGNFDLTPRNQDDAFAFRFRGRIRIPTPGSYTFYTTSDDGSQLRINDVLVVDNDGLHSATEVSGSITLAEGTHDIEVTHFERDGFQVLTVEYEGPGVSRQVIPSSVLTNGAAGSLRMGAEVLSDPAAVELGKWHRIALTAEVAGSVLECKAYIDGIQTTVAGLPASVLKPFDGDYALQSVVPLLADDSSETELCKINSLSHWGSALSAAQIAALGSPTAVGLPDIYVANDLNAGLGSLRRAVTDVRSAGLISWDLATSGQTTIFTSGGALEIIGKALIIDANHLANRPTLSGGDSHRTFNVENGANVTLRGLDLTSGFSPFGGGAIRCNAATMVIDQCSITDSDADFGGGIINEDSGSLTIIDTTISSNTADAGGGITNAGVATLLRCTIDSNSAGAAGGVEAINTTTLTNCTITGNNATDGGGGGISALGGLTTISCTITGNEAFDSFESYGGGGILLDISAVVVLDNTIVGGNLSNVFFEEDLGGFGFLTEYGVNLIGVNPGLGPLSDNGGYTHTMLPQFGSPAAAGGSTTGSTPATDQRGYPRVQGTLDIGAAETSISGTSTPFDAWATSTIPSGQNRTPGGDPELDGTVNLSEYAFRLDPMVYDPLGQPMAGPVAGTGGGTDFQIVIPIRASGIDLIYVVEESTTMQSWSEVYRYVVLTDTENRIDPSLVTNVDLNAETITVTNPALNLFTTFWRVKVLHSP